MVRTLIIGAGAAGLAAAVAAAEGGAEVAVLESQSSIGGTTRISQGFVSFAGTEEQAAASIDDHPSVIMKDLLSVADGAADSDLIAAYASRQLDTYRWLRSLGMSFGRPQAAAGQTRARSHVTQPDTWLALLRERAEALGARIHFGVRARRLLQEGGRVVGVAADTPSGDADYVADAVILATGGFTRNPRLLAELAPTVRYTRAGGGAGSLGDGLQMARAVGAGVRDLEFVRGTFGLCSASDGDLVLLPIYRGAIIVDASARRFVDESLDYKTLATATQGRPGMRALQVFDEQVMARADTRSLLYDFEQARALGVLHEAPTIVELAKLIGVDADALRTTVAGYNAAVDAGTPDPLGRETLSGVGRRIAIDQPPFYALESGILLSTTYCGITIDTGAGVLDTTGAPVAGLFAAGEVAGGFHGAGYQTGTAIGKALVFGRTAGLTAARGPRSTP